MSGKGGQNQPISGTDFSEEPGTVLGQRSNEGYPWLLCEPENKSSAGVVAAFFAARPRHGGVENLSHLVGVCGGVGWRPEAKIEK